MNAEERGSRIRKMGCRLPVPVPRPCLIIRAAGTQGREIQANIRRTSGSELPSRLLHDLGLAAWFGGTLANAVALNRAAVQASDPSSAGRVANAGWDAWTPINAVAIGATIVGSVGQLVGNKERLATQSGVASMSVIKTAPHCDRFGHHGLQQGAWAQGVPRKPAFRCPPAPSQAPQLRPTWHVLRPS